MDKELLIKKLEEYFSDKDEVKLAYLFGSYAKGTEKVHSDVDIAVYVDELKHFVDPAGYKTGEILGLQDFLRMNTDLVLLNTAPPLLVHQVFKYGIIIKNTDSSLTSHFRISNFYKYIDQMRISGIIFEANKKRIREVVRHGR